MAIEQKEQTKQTEQVKQQSQDNEGTMEVGIVDVDGHARKKKWGATIYPNLALCKIAAWHRQRGDRVRWATPMYHFDIIYMAKVFNFSPDNLYIYDADKIVKGGTGYNIESHLPEEIDRTQPPQWQKDMANWVNKKMIFETCEFADFMPRKGFKCKFYIEQFTK